MSDDEGDAKPGDVLTSQGWKPTHPIDKYIHKRYIPSLNSIKGKTPLHVTILSLIETRITILKERAEDEKLRPGVEYGKILTAIKEIEKLQDLIRGVKVGQV